MASMTSKYNTKETSFKKIEENLWEFDTKSSLKTYNCN
jgi:hypothetical protein